jgi:AcrR family transcriptional regulator
VPVWVIAQKAGVNKAMINYYFGGKRKLYLAIVSATFSEIVASVERLADSPPPAPEVLSELDRGPGPAGDATPSPLLLDDAARGARGRQAP